MSKVFYKPGKHWVTSSAVWDDEAQVFRYLYSGKTLEDLEDGTQIMEVEDATEAIRLLCIGPPKRITEERFDEMLNILPPVGWVNYSGSESFKMSERTNLDITAIFVRRGTDYFELQNAITLRHEEIMRIVDEQFPR